MRSLKRALVLVSLLLTGAAPAGLSACGENEPSCISEGVSCGFFVGCCGDLQCGADSKCTK
jgi:hypothetical protein